LKFDTITEANIYTDYRFQC